MVIYKMICLWVAHWHYTVGRKWRSIGHTLNLKWRKIVAVERTERKWSSFNEFPCHGTAKCLFNLCSFTHPRTMWMKESLIHTGQCYAIRLLFFLCVCSSWMRACCFFWWRWWRRRSIGGIDDTQHQDAWCANFMVKRYSWVSNGWKQR